MLNDADSDLNPRPCLVVGQPYPSVFELAVVMPNDAAERVHAELVEVVPVRTAPE